MKDRRGAVMLHPVLNLIFDKIVKYYVVMVKVLFMIRAASSESVKGPTFKMLVVIISK